MVEPFEILPQPMSRQCLSILQAATTTINQWTCASRSSCHTISGRTRIHTVVSIGFIYNMKNASRGSIWFDGVHAKIVDWKCLKSFPTSVRRLSATLSPSCVHTSAIQNRGVISRGLATVRDDLLSIDIYPQTTAFPPTKPVKVQSPRHWVGQCDLGNFCLFLDS